jgi:hypothetical protein
MPITRHHSGRWLYQFDRVIAGAGEQRANRYFRRLDASPSPSLRPARDGALYELQLVATAPEPLIEDAVLTYLTRPRAEPEEPARHEGALAILMPEYAAARCRPCRTWPASTPRAAGVEARHHQEPAGLPARGLPLGLEARRMGEHDPAERMVLPKVKNARHVYLTRANRRWRVPHDGPGWSRDAARVAFYTGWRISEVLEAKAAGDAGGLALSIDDTKNGLPRIVPVHPEGGAPGARPLAAQGHEVDREQGVKKALRAVGLGHARLHDLRHSAASEMINAGVDLYTVGGVLGHKSQVSTARYAHWRPSGCGCRGQDRGKPGKISQPAPVAKAA